MILNTLIERIERVQQMQVVELTSLTQPLIFHCRENQLFFLYPEIMPLIAVVLLYFRSKKFRNRSFAYRHQIVHFY